MCMLRLLGIALVQFGVGAHTLAHGACSLVWSFFFSLVKLALASVTPSQKAPDIIAVVPLLSSRCAIMIAGCPRMSRVVG